MGIPMGAGLSLIVIGALLAFAVEDDVSGINLGIAGLILMLAGAAVIAHARATSQKEQVTIRREETDESTPHTHVVQETIRQRRTE